MTLASIFSSARSGMFVAQSAAALVSRNLANVQTPGYAREFLPIATALGGLGVVSGPPVALRAALLERALIGANGRSGYFDAQVAHLGLAEEAVNDLDGVGLGQSIEDFRDALAQLSANPVGDIERQALIDRARALGAAFAATRSQLDQGARAVRDDAVAVAGEINALSEQIAAVDQRVRAARPGEEKNTYLAQRSALLNQLSSLVDIDVRPASDGTVTVSTAGGRALVDGGVANRLQVDVGAPPAGELTVSFVRSDGAPLAAIAGSEFGGKLGGLLAAHGDTFAPAIARLDALAFDFVSAFNAQHAAGFDAEGLPGGALFTPLSAVDGAAARVAVVAGFTPDDVAAGLDAALGVGDNANVLLLADIAGNAPALPGGLSLPDAWQGISLGVSQALVAANAGGAFEAASREQLENLLASETGVSIDEEMFNLTQAQTALEAASQVIVRAQQMTDTILSLVG